MSFVVTGRRGSEEQIRKLRSCASEADAKLYDQQFRDLGYIDVRVERASPRRLRSNSRSARRR